MIDSERMWLEETIPASDIWGHGKAITTLSPEEELEAWQQTVDVLENLGDMAETLLLEPLILAVGDAESRAREELARAEDRLSRPEGADLHPREEERLQVLQRRCEALMLDRDELSAETLEILGEMRRRAEESLRRYRAETGLLEPTA